MLVTEKAGPHLEIWAVSAVPAIAPALEHRIEEIWKRQTSLRAGNLFNGRIFSISAIANRRIEGCFVEYKWFVAQRHDPSVRAALDICPLAITGLLLCSDGVVVGRRGSNVEQAAGEWELVPSGGVDETTLTPEGRVEIVDQVRIELLEELGIQPERICGAPAPFAIVFDTEAAVRDVGIRLQTDMRGAEVVDAFNHVAAPEHTALEVLPEAVLLDYMSRSGIQFSATSFALLAAAGIGG